MSNLDFTTFTESDPNSHLTIDSSSQISFSGLTAAETAYVYKDYGTGGLTDFTFDVDFLVSSRVQYGYMEALVVSTVLDNTLNRVTNGDPSLSFAIGNIDNSNYYLNFPYEAAVGTTYYLRMVRSGDTAYMRVYSDAGRTNLLATKTVTGLGSQAYRYLMLPCGNGSGTGSSTGTLANLAVPTTNFTATPSGGVTVSGTGDLMIHGDFTTDFTVIISGSSDGFVNGFILLVDPVVSVSGTAEIVTSYVVIADGGIELTPSYLHADELVSSGSIVWSGVSVAYHRVDYDNLVDTAMLGTPWVTGTITALGIVPLGGFADIRGWIRFSGKATYKDYAYVPSGGVTLASTTTAYVPSSFLVSAWVQFERQTAQCVYCRGTQLWFGVDQYRRITLTINTVGNRGVTVTGSTLLDPFAYYHVSGVLREGKELAVYFFGVLDGVVTFDPVTLGPDGVPQIGLYANNLLQWSGALDEVRFSRQLFSPDDVYADSVGAFSALLGEEQSPLAFAGRSGGTSTNYIYVVETVDLVVGGELDVRLTCDVLAEGAFAFTGGGKLGLKFPASGTLSFSGDATTDFGYRFLMSGSGLFVLSGDAEEEYSRIFSFVSVVDTRIGGTAGRIFFRGSAVKLRGVHFIGSGNFTFKSGGKLGLYFTGDTAWWTFNGESSQRVRRRVTAVRVPITFSGESVPVDFGMVGSGKLTFNGTSTFHKTYAFYFTPTVPLRVSGSSQPTRITFNPVGSGSLITSGGARYYMRFRMVPSGNIAYDGVAVEIPTFAYVGSGTLNLSNEDWCFVTSGDGLLEISGTIEYARGIVGSGGIRFHSPLVARLLGELTTHGCFDGLLSVGRLSSEQ